MLKLKNKYSWGIVNCVESVIAEWHWEYFSTCLFLNQNQNSHSVQNLIPSCYHCIHQQPIRIIIVKAVEKEVWKNKLINSDKGEGTSMIHRR